MNEQGPRPGRMIIAAALFLAFAGSAWYIAYLRAQNSQLRTHEPSTHAAAPAAHAAPVAAAPAAPANAGPDRSLSGAQRDAMLEKLRATTSTERPVWFATYAGNPEAAAYR